jgi:hypothetical protein
MHHTIAGVDRIIDQVGTFSEYNDVSKMSANEIFYGARADRAYYKELQKSMHKKMSAFIGGATFVHLPIVAPITAADVVGGTELEKAHKLEEYYTFESAKFSQQP